MWLYSISTPKFELHWCTKNGDLLSTRRLLLNVVRLYPISYLCSKIVKAMNYDRGGEIHSPGRHGDQIFVLANRKKILLFGFTGKKKNKSNRW